jgi:transcriptional regulator with XRE-family HTH domain
MSAIRHIRLHIFGVTQAEFAALAGVTQASVSRWEAGVAPSLDDMRAIREAALARWHRLGRWLVFRRSRRGGGG